MNMKKIACFLALVAFAAVPGLLAEEEAAPEARTLKGDFVWSASGSGGDLEAVFTPTGEDRWEVAFHFDFRGAHTYSGTAEGSLSEGTLKGEVQNEGKKRTFRFAGSFEDGTFRGDHSEVAGENEQPTGTMTLGS